MNTSTGAPGMASWIRATVRVGLGGVAGDDADVGAAAGQLDGGRLADAVGRPGDDHHRQRTHDGWEARRARSRMTARTSASAPKASRVASNAGTHFARPSLTT